MTEERLKELNDMSDEMNVLKRMLTDIKMLRELTINCSSGVCIIGEDFRHSSIVRSLCDKLEPAVEEELENLEKEFACS